ncbi:MAG TPA: HEAT repeat domain-containing protein [Candidatus Acidoferrum sp.]|nr:HEAT repeat domain-containing protein [Candidatus Acidoferrum sp.]
MSDPRGLACKGIASLLVFYACGETNAQETAQIEEHLAVCPDCSAQLAEERALHASLMEALQAAEQSDAAGILLSQCRSELAEALDDLSAPALREPRLRVSWLRRWMILRPVWSGAFLVLFGAAVGTQLLPWYSAHFASSSDAQTVSVSASAKLTDEQLSKMAVAGINIVPPSEGAPGTLQVHMRTEQPFVLSGSVDDPDLRRVLTYVVENGDQTDPGVRLDCLDALRTQIADQDVRRALLYAASKDQNPAVRMKALEALRDTNVDQSMREVLIGALEHDANPGVRVEAVNILVHSLEPGAPGTLPSQGLVAPPALADQPLDPSLEQVVRTLHELERNDPNRYVRLRSAAALRQIGPREVQ